MPAESVSDTREDERVRAVETALELRIVEALETVPTVRITADFAARVAGQLPRRHPIEAASFRKTHYGRNAMLGGLAMLLLGMLVLAPGAFSTGQMGVTLQWLVCAQFVALVWWLSVQKGRSL